MQQAEISVIIPVFNVEKYLVQALESVFEQETTPLEIIVIDDGSTDKSVETIRKFRDRITIFQLPHKGAASARNFGISRSNGNFLAFLDADDLWTANHLSVLLNSFSTENKVDMVLGNLEQFISPELTALKNSGLIDELKVFPGYHPGAMLIKKEAFLKTGMLNEELQLAEFVDWFMRAEEMGIQQRIIPDIVYRRRIHLTNQGILKKEYLKDYTTVLRAALKRRKT